MKISLETPLEIQLEKFKSEFKKDDMNSFVLRKPLIQKYQEAGYKVLFGEDFEENLIIEFVRKHKFIDKYLKVKLGEFKSKESVKEYNETLIDVLGMDIIEKLLFLCRVCSYVSDPSFPNYIIYNNEKILFRYSYTDEIIDDIYFFIFLARMFGIDNIKFSALDFEDFENPEKIEIDMEKLLEKVIQKLENRISLEHSLEETGIDFQIFKKWLETGEADPEDLFSAYNNFMEKISEDKSLNELISKLDNLNLKDKTRKEKEMIIVKELGIDIIKAHDVLNLYEISNFV